MPQRLFRFLLPLAVLAIPLIGFLDHNKLVVVDEEIARILAWWIAGSVAIGLVGTLVGLKFPATGTRLAAICSVACALLLLHRSMPVEAWQYWMIFVGAVCAVAVLAVFRTAQRALVIGAFAAAAVPAGSFVAHWSSVDRASSMVAAADTDRPMQAKNPVNVYFFVTDGYSGSHSLALDGIDNADFYADLDRRGFVVPEHARANYPMTFMAVSTMLEMRYLADETTPRFLDRSEFHGVFSRKSAVLARFEDLGYTTAKLSSGYWGATRCHAETDMCFEPSKDWWFTQLEYNLLQLTPFAFGQFEEVAPAINMLSDAQTYLPLVQARQPFLYFGHTLPPHPPLIFDASCKLLPSWSGVTFANPADYEKQVRCVNAQILDFADHVIAQDPDAIIIFTADHGADTRVDWEARLADWTDEAVLERFNIFTAIRLPEVCSTPVSDELSPVNLFRLALACVEGRQPDLLPDRSFISVYEDNPDYGLVKETQVRF